MSIYTKQTQVAEFPAYAVFERECEPGQGYVNITVNDELGLDSGKGFYRTYTPGSVASYALKYNECPIAAVEECKAKMISQPYNGHKLHWINQNSTCISSSPQAQRKLIKVKIGMLVRFEGQLFTIQPDHNNNLRFI